MVYQLQMYACMYASGWFSVGFSKYINLFGLRYCVIRCIVETKCTILI